MSLGRRTSIAVALGLIIVLAAPLTRATPVAHASIFVQPGFTQILTTGPLTQINVGIDTTIQVVDHRVSPSGEFYYYPQINCTADFGVFVNIGNKLYGPTAHTSWHCSHSIMNQPDVVFIPLSQTSSGSRTAGSPYTVVTTVRLTSSVTLTQTVSYVTGQSFFTETNTLNNAGAAVNAKIFDGAEPDPGSRENAYGYYDPFSGSVGATNPVDPNLLQVNQCGSGVPLTGYFYNVYFSPTSPSTMWQHSVVDWYYNVFNDISASDGGASLPGFYNLACIDPAMAVEWDITVAGGTSSTVSKYVNFTTNLAPLRPGTISGQAQCNAISGPAITCGGIPPPCLSCGSSYNFLLPARCSNAPTVDLQNRPCAGSFDGHIGFISFSVAIAFGGIAATANGYTAKLYGHTFSQGNALITLTDDEVTLTDTINLRVGNVINYTWTCRNRAICLEIIPSA